MIIDPRSVAVFALLAALILAVSAIVASAQNAPVMRSPYNPIGGHWEDEDGQPYRKYVRHRPRHREYTLERRREVRGWHSQARGYYPSDEKCKAPVAVVGDQYASEAGAQDEARKNWMATVRYMHGERMMPIANAEDITFECGRSSVGSVVGQVFYRCRLSARPCRSEPKREDR